MPSDLKVYFFTKVPRLFKGRRQYFRNKWGWNNWKSTCRKANLHVCLPRNTAPDSKGIVDVHVKHRTIQGENTGFCDLGLSQEFLDRMSKAQSIKPKK